ncbi:NACHT domain-containing protein [Coleofasciculus sp. FACHB-T130]|uniref:NACHT C-terminal alpha/beta 1 domain-containing protein n=1 Tax=Cyanophyceae TaxID=3028117 RepID=UPI00168879F1|nr:NACHT domain-containing protein [Coleofasciculus sp. FACHB-T130]MBD1880319.1 NACHT domain-containing protein [Coleofasciculus sp. FACHB-T130]
MGRNLSKKKGKEHAKILLNALLRYINNELSKTEIRADWQEGSQLWVTQATLENLAALVSQCGSNLNGEEIRNALHCLINLKILQDQRGKISAKTVTNTEFWRFSLNFPATDREENIKWLFNKGGEWDRCDQSRKSNSGDAQKPISKESDDFDWRKICQTMLECQKRLTTNQLMSDEDMKFEIDDVYVELGLVERKKQPKVAGGDFAEQGSRLYEPEYEEMERFEHQRFLQDVLKDGKGKSNGKRIAIIGEPGAGKSTLLRKIAFWVLENTSDLPILITLADLPETNPQQEFLEQYLLGKWLKAALPFISPDAVEVTEALKTELKRLCNQGRVWLVLDGVDEMPLLQGEPLLAIQNQLNGWVGQTWMVLSCRLNVWDANRNVLADNFEIYRTLEFSYGEGKTPDRVGEFIAKRFKREPELGEQLRQALDELGKERIKDLAKNPLRLTLLCSTWSLWRENGGLPDTKAKLYKGFVEKFYEWKGKEFFTTLSQQMQLNQVLGELAKLAIDQTASRFRLKHSLVCQVLGHPDQPLYKLAIIQLSWLNNVGLAAENPDETVYAFFHPTFQEYFAALAIDDWCSFLTHDKDNPQPLPGNVYRIFEPQWKEVILLWLGRDKREVADEQKEEFIQALVEFKDGCSDFYRYQAYFLAAAGIAEFGGCRLAETIVAQLVEKGFGYFSIDSQEWRTFPEPIEEEAKAALRESDRSKVMSALTNLVHTCQSKYRSSCFTSKWGQKICVSDEICMKAAVILLTIFPENPDALSALHKLNDTSEDVWVQGQFWLCENNVNKLIELENKRFNWSINSLQKQARDKNLSLDGFPAFADEEYSIDSADTLEENIKVILRKMDAPKDAIALWQNLSNLELLVLKAASQGKFFSVVITHLKNYLSEPVGVNPFGKECFKIIWIYYAKHISYPAFYQAWNPTYITLFPETTAFASYDSQQSLNISNLPQLLNTAIANNSSLNDTIHLICINGSKFENPDKPASEIYAEMVLQGCPERQNGEPETMQALKVYCQLKCQGVFLIFDEDTSGEPSQGFSQTFLTSLSKFHNVRRICVVSEQPCNLQTFSPSQPNLVADIVSWILEKMIEE